MPTTESSTPSNWQLFNIHLPSISLSSSLTSRLWSRLSSRQPSRILSRLSDRLQNRCPSMILGICRHYSWLVWAMVQDHGFGSESCSIHNGCQVGGPGCPYIRTLIWGMVHWKPPNPSDLGWLPTGCPAGPSVDSYNAFILLFDNSITSISQIQKPVVSVWMFCGLRCWVFWKPCFWCNALYSCVSRRLTIMLWAHISVWYHDYSICRTKHCWYCVDAYFHNAVSNMSWTVLADKATTTSYMNHGLKVTLWLATMQDHKTVDTPFTIIFWMGHGVCCYCFCLWRRAIPHWWMFVTNNQLNYPRWRTKNRWHSVDVHFLDGVVSVSALYLPLKAASTLFMDVCIQ